VDQLPDYYKTTYAHLVLAAGRHNRAVAKETVLAYNRAHYELVRAYVTSREQAAEACAPDPLFIPLLLDTLKRKAAQLRALPTGRVDGSDKRFEDLAFDSSPPCCTPNSTSLASRNAPSVARTSATSYFTTTVKPLPARLAGNLQRSADCHRT
jgi:hypothetical protein